MSNDTLDSAIQRVLAIGSTSADAVEVLRPAFDTVFSAVSIESVDGSDAEEVIFLDQQLDIKPVAAVVCASSRFWSKYADEMPTKPPHVHLFVVDIDDTHDPDEIQSHPNVTYIHSETPEKQIIATLQASLPTAQRAIDTISDTTNTATTELTPVATGPFSERLFYEAPLPLLVAEGETGTIVAVNDRACELLGRSREALLGANQVELHPDNTDIDYQEGFQHSVDAAGIDSFVQYNGPRYVEDDNGEEVPIDIIDTTIEINGQVYVVGAFLDVSDRVNEQAALRRRSKAIEASLTGISILDPDERYTYMNDAHAEIFGYDPDELLGESWRTLYDEQTQAEIEAGPFEELEETGAWEGELMGVRQDGEPVEHYISLTQLADGGIICVNRDISDRKQFERRLKSVRETAHSLMLAENRDTIINQTIELIAEKIDRPLAGYLRYNGSEDKLLPASVSSQSRELLDNLPSFRRGEGLVWRAFEANEVRYYPDLTNIDDVYNQDTPIGSELHIPVGNRGVFIIGSTKTDAISANERKLLEITVSHVRTALTLVERQRELKQARKKVEAEREQLRQVIDTVPQFIFAKNEAGEFIFANEATAKAYGTTPSELEGKTDADFAPNNADVEVFTQDDRTVIETGEPVYRYGETLTDADGNERILETIKVPFEPIGVDGPAVLGSSTDITELQRTQKALDHLQRLNSINELESELRHCRTSAEIHEAGIETVLRGLDDIVVATYSWDEADGVLHQMAKIPTEGNQFPETVTTDDQTYWRAFTTGYDQRLDDTSDERGYAVPIGSAGLLVVSNIDDDSEQIPDFLTTVGNVLATAIERSKQQESVEDLRATLDSVKTDLNSVQTQLETLADTVEQALEAETRSELDQLLVEFIDTNWRYGWVGDFKPQMDAVIPRAATDDTGPVSELETGSDVEMRPALEAATTRSTVYVERTLAERDRKWATAMLAYGYRSVLSIPIIDQGVIYGVVEVASTDVDGFDTRTTTAIRSLCRIIGHRLRQLDIDNVARLTAESVEIDLAFTDSRPFFPSLPSDTSIQVRNVITVDSSTRRLQMVVSGASQPEFETYLSQIPSLYDTIINHNEAETVFKAEVSLDVSRRAPTEMLFEEIVSREVRVSNVLSGSEEELITFTVADRSTASVIADALTARFEGASLLAKRTREESDIESFAPTHILTNRQREVLQTAYSEGYYDQPKGINGQEIAELFDISHSTVHEHLKAAERKVLRAFLPRDVPSQER
ncbi:PAS domain S-box protein [Natranaeroarchaeum sulfidigenes]|uniref:Bacterio-opsin activator protein (Contains PAS, GAF and HTH domains) n=1 Tax=Natranaeroarchaeum sulfidigenes TaxID=2784880 RepID=A0A897MU95_9EURY|nr:PAS domain S-box protein [Natranaeroarchaeum sulfidigenes]QSG04082.1 Bacterio-opsin activator protein (contains PAS, GAF and HTH domains) [Natranaeroarchaeum sulfidigenes]